MQVLHIPVCFIMNILYLYRVVHKIFILANLGCITFLSNAFVVVVVLECNIYQTRLLGTVNQIYPPHNLTLVYKYQLYRSRSQSQKQQDFGEGTIINEFQVWTQLMCGKQNKEH